MGIIDVKIDVIRESQSRKWQERSISHFNTNLLQQQGQSTKSADGQPKQLMEPDLYNAAMQSDAEGFEVALNDLGVRRGQTVSEDEIFRCVSPQGNTLLHVAAQNGNRQVAEHLAFRVPSLLVQKNYDGDTALHLASEAGHIGVAEVLIQMSADPAAGDPQVPMIDARNEQGNTALHKALISAQMNLDLASQLVREYPQMMFQVNNENKSGLYLAAEAGYEDLIRETLKAVLGIHNNSLGDLIKGRSPVHAAILGKHRDILNILLEEDPNLILMRDTEGRTPLHLAASTGYLEGVRILLHRYPLAAAEKDQADFFPVHWASIKGHVDVMDLLLQHCPYPAEILDRHRRNILHIAAKNGKQKVVSYILKSSQLKMLLNGKDKDGNTPLHLATMYWHPRIVSALTWHGEIDLTLTNKNGLTALDAAEFYMGCLTSFQHRLTWTALMAAGAPRAPSTKCQHLIKEGADTASATANINHYKERVNTLLLVATLLATMTFAAGFTLPGGYRSSGPDDVEATVLRHRMFHLFIFCDTISMYSSVVVAAALIWAQLGDLNLVLLALRLGLPLLGVSLSMMPLAFMAGIYVVVADLQWLALSVLIMGCIFFVTLAALSFPLCFPITSNILVLRYISYYPFRLLMFVTNCRTSNNWEED